MKDDTIKNTFLAVTVLSLLSLAVGCKPTMEDSQKSTSEQLDTIKKEAKQTAQDISDYTFAQKVEFTDKMKAQLVVINTDLDQLAARIEKSSDEVKEEAKPKIQALRDQAAQLDKQLDEAKNATESTWDSVKLGTKKAFDGMKDSFQQSRQWLSDKIKP